MVKTPKALFHPDGGLFVIWHPDHQAYSPVISDEDVPPTAQSLNLNDRSITEHDALVWRPIRMTSQFTVIEEENVLHPYDPDTGEEEI